MRLVPILLAIVGGAAACAEAGTAGESVQWAPELRVAGAMMPGARLVLTAEGIPAAQAPWVPLRWPEDSLSCAATRVAVRARGDTVYAAWWRSDSLLMTRADDGVNWLPAVAVGAVGVNAGAPCTAPPPAIAADPVTGALHIAFHGRAGTASDSTGIVLVSVRESGTPRAPPMLVAADPRPRPVAVSAQGDTVAIAHEATGLSGTTIRLAISLRRGQIPATRGVVPAGDGRAFAPAVALGGGRVAVSWNEARRANRPPAAVARVGEIVR